VADLKQLANGNSARSGATSSEWFDRARRLMPGGVSSPVRSFGAVGGVPRFIASARGCRLTDVEGNEYLDYIGSWGAMIVGHAHPAVVEAVRNALDRGTSFGTASPYEIELAEEIIQRMPSIQKLRFVNSGTEAAMSGVRLARAATGRNLIVKFAGCYHGHHDSFLVQAGSGVATLGLPNSPGVPMGVTADTRIAPYNDPAALESLFEREGELMAAIIVEPVAANMGVAPPHPGFLKGLRRLCDRYGCLLIFDEVITGFRVAYGGAQQLYDVSPDLTILGKIIGGGLPVGAYGGRADLMSLVAPEGPVYQAGTLSGNPLAMAAGLATLKLLDGAAYERLEMISIKLEQGLRSAADRVNLESTLNRFSSMLTIFFHRGPVGNFSDAAAADHTKFAKFFHLMLDQGIHLPPSGYEAWFVSLAHDPEAITATVMAAGKAFERMTV